MAHHESQVRVLILNLTVWEADAGHELVRHVDHSADNDLNTLALLVELSLRTLHLLLVTTDEQSRHMVTVWELPRCSRLLIFDHVSKVIEHLLRFTCLLEGALEHLAYLALIVAVTLNVDS